MKGRAVKEGWIVIVNEAEGQLLAHCFAKLAAHYEVSIQDLPERLQAYWRGTISRQEGCRKSEWAEAQADLEETRRAWRSQRLEVLKEWLCEYDAQRNEPNWELKLNADRMDLFLSILNDRRLTLAAEWNIGDEEMDSDPCEVKREEVRQALWEIHLLSYFQEQCLELIRRRSIDD